MNINIGSEQYELDVNKAKELGIIKLRFNPKDVKAGDVLYGENPHHELCLVVSLFNENKFILLSLNKNGFPLSSFSGIPSMFSKSELIKYINENKLIFKKNITNEVTDLAK